MIIGSDVLVAISSGRAERLGVRRGREEPRPPSLVFSCDEPRQVRTRAPSLPGNHSRPALPRTQRRAEALPTAFSDDGPAGGDLARHACDVGHLARRATRPTQPRRAPPLAPSQSRLRPHSRLPARSSRAECATRSAACDAASRGDGGRQQAAQHALRARGLRGDALGQGAHPHGAGALCTLRPDACAATGESTATQADAAAQRAAARRHCGRSLSAADATARSAALR